MTAIDLPLADRDYGDKVAAVEPGGVEFIPMGERHGSPVQLLWTWASPNFEFATIFVGALGPLFFGLSFLQSALAIVVGSALGSITHGYLSSMGPKTGLPQMVAGRSAFGFRGNAIPSVINSVMAGIGWFAVNSVSGALALNTLTGMPGVLSLVVVVAIQVVVAFFGHNLVHAFERYAFPVLAVIFLVATVIIFTKSHLGAPSQGGGIGGFLVLASAAFGYAAGWNPYASDYTRYLPPTSNGARVGLFAGLGVFISCLVLELAGAAAVTIGKFNADNPTASFTGHLPTLVADLTLLAIALGAVSANVLNIYSGSMAFLALEIKLPTNIRRALVAVAFGLIGFFVAWSGLSDAGTKYENFLLVIAYWVAPWLGVVLVDRYLRRGTSYEGTMTTTSYANWAGPIAFVVALVVSVWLFSDQTQYVGPIAKANSNIGDITPVIGFLLAAVIYVALFKPLAQPAPATPAEIVEQ
jgi:NCS1 family nucleobase:cation symporter-1